MALPPRRPLPPPHIPLVNPAAQNDPLGAGALHPNQAGPRQIADPWRTWMESVDRALTGVYSTSSQWGNVIGAVTDFAGSDAPSGWALCYGQEISRVDYAMLFDVIGTTYGTGDGSSTFNLPDCRGRIAAGKDDMGGGSAERLNTISSTTLGASGGNQSRTLAVGNIPQMTTSTASLSLTPSDADVLGNIVFLDNTSGGGSMNLGGNVKATGNLSIPNHDHTVGSASPSAVSVVQPTIIFNKIIFHGVFS